MQLIFQTGNHSFLLPSEQLEELKETGFTTFIYALPDFTEEHIELEAWKCKWTTELLKGKLLIESNIDLAALTNADGVILKKEDLPPEVARAKLGDAKWVVGKASTYEDALNFFLEGADALLIGPLRTPNRDQELGSEGIAKIQSLLQDNNVRIPVWVYGGIVPDDVERLKKLGLEGISVSSFILQDDEIDKAAKLFK